MFSRGQGQRWWQGNKMTHQKHARPSRVLRFAGPRYFVLYPFFISFIHRARGARLHDKPGRLSKYHYSTGILQ